MREAPQTQTSFAPSPRPQGTRHEHASQGGPHPAQFHPLHPPHQQNRHRAREPGRDHPGEPAFQPPAQIYKLSQSPGCRLPVAGRVFHWHGRKLTTPCPLWQRLSGASHPFHPIFTRPSRTCSGTRVGNAFFVVDAVDLPRTRLAEEALQHLHALLPQHPGGDLRAVVQVR